MKEKETKTQKKPRSKGMKVLLSILNTIINIMIVVVLVVSILIAVMAITSKANNGISTLFGYTIQPIQSDSMKGDSPDGYPGGDFGKGDLMIAKATNYDATAVYDLGDIVTFRSKDSATNEYMLIAHRIVDVVDNNGVYSYQTQGDNRETSPVPDQPDPSYYINAGDIGSVFYSDAYQGTILKGWGAPLDFLKSQQGFFFVVLLPMIIFFMYELIRVVLNVTNYKKAKSDEEKDAAVKEAVAAALAEKQSEGSDLPESLEDMTPEQLEQFKQFLKSQEEQKAAESASEEENYPTEDPSEISAESEADEETETPEE